MDNHGNDISPRGISMLKGARLLAGAALLIAAVALLLIFEFSQPQPQKSLPALAAAGTAAPAMRTSVWTPGARAGAMETAPALASTTGPSRREQLLAEMRDLAGEYERAVQKEKLAGAVEYAQVPENGAQAFRFTGQSAEKILILFDQFNQELLALSREYLEAYRAEIRPTPFPTPPAAQENEAYYNLLLEQYRPLYELEMINATKLRIYDPDQGTYQERIIGDAYARTEIAAQAFEELRLAPLAVIVDQEADMAHIRQLRGRPDLRLTYSGIEPMPNAHGLEAAAYQDDSGVTYLVAVGTGRLAQFYPGQRSVIPASEARPAGELRIIGERFAESASLRFPKLKAALVYEESCKGSLCFFTWRDTSRDWSGTDWEMMPPFLQVGVLADGQVTTFINTLDLMEEPEG